jgi:hypothetical protein
MLLIRRSFRSRSMIWSPSNMRDVPIDPITGQRTGSVYGDDTVSRDGGTGWSTFTVPPQAKEADGVLIRY